MYVGFSLYLGLMFSLMKQYHRRLREKPLKLETLSGKLRTKEANSRFPSFADLIVKAHTKNQRIFSDRHRREGSKRLAEGGGDRVEGRY